MNVGIVGSGEMVDALAHLARAARNTVVVSPAPAPFPDPVDLVLFALPPDQIRAAVRAFAPGPDVRLVVATRGLEPESGKRLSEVVLEESACLRVGALAGPILPSEVRRGSPCAAVVASAFTEVTRLGSAALHSSACRIYTSDDLPGVELAGALVEVLAMALGTARGLALGVAAQALIVTRGVAEGARLAVKGKGDPRTFAGLAGVGDLVTCAGLTDHPAHARGLALARGETDPAAAALCAALLRREPDLPITEGVAALAAGRARAQEVIAALMQREHREERD